MLSQPGCIVNTRRIIVPQDFKDGKDQGGRIFKFPYFKDGKISPEMWQVVTEPGKERAAADTQFITLFYYPSISQWLFPKSST